MCLKPSNLLPDETASLCNQFEKLLLHSASNSTWKKHCSAWNSLRLFCNKFKIELNLPLDVKHVRAYTTWALTERKLQASTVESYISSIVFAHRMADKECVNFTKDKCVQMLLKGGGGNVSLLSGETNSSRLAMNIYLLKILGHRISLEKWDDMSKQVIWTASVICFYTSCRMGELVSACKNNFDSITTLKWQNVKFMENNEAVVFLPSTKSTGLKGAFIDIFPLKGDSTCPYAALNKLKEINMSNNSFIEKNPVFRFKSSLYLTTDKMNKLLHCLLSDFTDANHKITCHSFRAAIPSAMASHPETCTVREVKEWGRWHSDSFEKYTKQERDKKRKLFYKTINLL